MAPRIIECTEDDWQSVVSDLRYARDAARSHQQETGHSSFVSRWSPEGDPDALITISEGRTETDFPQGVIHQG